MDNTDLKHTLIALTGGPVKVRQGVNSHRNGILVFLPKSIRLDASRLAAVASAIETHTGRIDFMLAMRTPGPARPYFVISPLTE